MIDGRDKRCRCRAVMDVHEYGDAQETLKRLDHVLMST